MTESNKKPVVKHGNTTTTAAAATNSSKPPFPQANDPTKKSQPVGSGKRGRPRGRPIGSTSKNKKKDPDHLIAMTERKKKKRWVNLGTGTSLLTMYEALTTVVLNTLGKRDCTMDELRQLAHQTCKGWSISPGELTSDLQVVLSVFRVIGLVGSEEGPPPVDGTMVQRRQREQEAAGAMGPVAAAMVLDGGGDDDARVNRIREEIVQVCKSGQVNNLVTSFGERGLEVALEWIWGNFKPVALHDQDRGEYVTPSMLGSTDSNPGNGSAGATDGDTNNSSSNSTDTSNAPPAEPPSDKQQPRGDAPTQPTPAQAPHRQPTTPNTTATVAAPMSTQGNIQTQRKVAPLTASDVATPECGVNDAATRTPSSSTPPSSRPKDHKPHHLVNGTDILQLVRSGEWMKIYHHFHQNRFRALFVVCQRIAEYLAERKASGLGTQEPVSNHYHDNVLHMVQSLQVACHARLMSEAKGTANNGKHHSSSSSASTSSKKDLKMGSNMSKSALGAQKNVYKVSYVHVNKNQDRILASVDHFVDRVTELRIKKANALAEEENLIRELSSLCDLDLHTNEVIRPDPIDPNTVTKSHQPLFLPGSPRLLLPGLEKRLNVSASSQARARTKEHSVPNYERTFKAEDEVKARLARRRVREFQKNLIKKKRHPAYSGKSNMQSMDVMMGVAQGKRGPGRPKGSGKRTKFETEDYSPPSRLMPPVYSQDGSETGGASGSRAGKRTPRAVGPNYLVEPMYGDAIGVEFKVETKAINFLQMCEELFTDGFPAPRQHSGTTAASSDANTNSSTTELPLGKSNQANGKAPPLTASTVTTKKPAVRRTSSATPLSSSPKDASALKKPSPVQVTIPKWKQLRITAESEVSQEEENYDAEKESLDDISDEAVLACHNAALLEAKETFEKRALEKKRKRQEKKEKRDLLRQEANKSPRGRKSRPLRQLPTTSAEANAGDLPVGSIVSTQETTPKQLQQITGPANRSTRKVAADHVKQTIKGSPGNKAMAPPLVIPVVDNILQAMPNAPANKNPEPATGDDRLASLETPRARAMRSRPTRHRRHSGASPRGALPDGGGRTPVDDAASNGSANTSPANSVSSKSSVGRTVPTRRTRGKRDAETPRAVTQKRTRTSADDDSQVPVRKSGRVRVKKVFE